MRSISEKRAAIEIASELAKPIEIMESLIKVAFAIKDEHGQHMLRDFFREIDLLQSLNWYISDRITKRFLTRFSSIKKSSPGYSYSDAMINSIGEFVLVSFGIISPELFKRMQGELRILDQLSADQLTDQATDGKISLQQQLEKYSLRQGGSLFWCRWDMPGLKLSHKTDEKVRNFIREIMNKDKTNILEALGYQEFFKRLRDAKHEMSKEDALSEFARIFYETISNEVFLNYIKEQRVKSWYPALKSFLYFKSDKLTSKVDLRSSNFPSSSNATVFSRETKIDPDCDDTMRLVT